MRKWMPLVPPGVTEPDLYVDEQEVLWADFVGLNWIVTLNGAGDMHVWSLPDLKRHAIVRNVIGEPTLTPDGKRVIFLQHDSVCVLDAEQLAITGTRRIGEIPEDAQLAIHPSGRLLAIAGKQRSIVVDLKSGEQMQAMMEALRPSKGRDLKSTLGWMGGLLYSRRQLYDFDSPIAVWEFNRPEWAMPVGNSYFAIVPHKKSRDLVLRSFQVPHQQIMSKVKNAFNNRDLLHLRRGDPVRVDVSGLPAERRTEIAGVLTRRLKEKGFRVARQASVSLVAELDKQPKELTVRYYILKEFEVFPRKDSEWLEMTYNRRRAWMRFVKDGKPIWSVSKYVTPPTTVYFSKEEGTGGGSAFGDPDYSIYSERKLPDYLRKRNSKIGTTKLYAEGMEHR